MNDGYYHISELKKHFAEYSSISVDDFYEFYKEVFEDIKRSTVKWYIYQLKKDKIIKHISRGRYAFENEETLSDEYVVITIDIIKSSDNDYSEFNRELNRKVEQINAVLKHTCCYGRQYYISQGDEIQILCPFDNQISLLFLLTLSYLTPYKARYGISIGRIDEEIKENSWDMNGPIFWNARDQITKIKSSKDYNGLIVSGYNNADSLCNNILPLINRSISEITEKQWQAIRYELSEKELSKTLNIINISKTSYYERIAAASLNEIKAALGAILELMKARSMIG